MGPGSSRDPPRGTTALYTIAIAPFSAAANRAAQADYYLQHFTADELKAIADFNGSPLGKSVMSKFGVYLAEMMPAMQAEIVKALAATQKEKSAAKK